MRAEFLHAVAVLHRGTCIPRSRPSVIRVAIRHANCGQVRAEHLDLDARFLQPPPERKQGVGASPKARQHRRLLDDPGGALGHSAHARIRHQRLKQSVSAAAIPAVLAFRNPFAWCDINFY
jgi:hypothetical protein